MPDAASERAACSGTMQRDSDRGQRHRGRRARQVAAHRGDRRASLARHTALESELKKLKANIREVEKKKDEMIAAARAKISEDEAKG